MERRHFIFSLSGACACGIVGCRADAASSDANLDFCTELALDATESARWWQTEWETPPQNDDEAASLVAKQWKKTRKVLNVDFLNDHGNPKLKDRVIEAAKGWEDHMGLTFSFGAAEPEILVSFQPGKGHWSYVGTDSLSKSRAGEPSMNFGWESAPFAEREVRRVSLHEFGHALSLIHEHQHPDAGIPWDRNAVFEYYRKTQGWDDTKIERNMFVKYSKSQVNRTRYDTDSIMHYAIPAALLTDPAYATSWNTRLSSLDEGMAEYLFPKV
jgi:serralysin